MHKNGSNTKIVNGGRAQGFDGIGLNISESSSAEFAELAFWNKSLQKADIDEAEAYLAWKWGLQDSLPNDHPYANRITELNDQNKSYPKRAEKFNPDIKCPTGYKTFTNTKYFAPTPWTREDRAYTLEECAAVQEREKAISKGFMFFKFGEKDGRYVAGKTLGACYGKNDDSRKGPGEVPGYNGCWKE